MTSTYEAVTMLVSFLFSYFFLFVWLPSLFIRFDPDSSSPLDKLFISLTHSTLFFMIAIHLLVAVRLLETLTLFALILIAFVILTRYYSRSESVSLTIKVMTALFDLSEDREQWKIELRKWREYFKEKMFNHFCMVKQGMVKHPILIAAYLTVFGAAAINRFGFSFTHVRFVMSDPYTHLGWSKYMANMDMYSDGVYPYGFESIICALFIFFHLDMYVTVRFIGPVVMIIMMLSLVYALRRMVGKDHPTILLTIFLWAFSAAIMLGEPGIMMRQITALSMEFTTLFLLPGITFFHLFFKTDKRMYLILAAECFAIASFAHTFVAVTMTLSYLAVGIAHFGKLMNNKTLIHIITYMGIAGFVGILPPIVGLLMGHPIHGASIDYMKDEFLAGGGASALAAVKVFAREQPLLAIMVLGFVVYLNALLIKFLRKGKKKSTFEHAPVILAGTFLLLMIFGKLFPRLGLPVLVPVDRQNVFLSLAAGLFFGIGWGYLASLIKGDNLRRYLQVLVSCAIALMILISPGQTLQAREFPVQQYDEAMRGVLDIKSKYPYRGWDIISPIDELGVIRGYGYHHELWEFVRDIDDPNVPSIKFTTPYVFLFVEKVPLDILNASDYRQITPEEADMPFPVHTDEQGPLTEFYYWYNLQNRRILQAKAYYWAEDYMKNHTDMKVFMDTPRYKIYEIYQGKDEVILTRS